MQTGTTKIRNSKRNARGSFVPTTVRGVRAEDSFWEMVDGVAKAKGKTRNGLIVEAVEDYCKKAKGGGKSV